VPTNTSGTTSSGSGGTGGTGEWQTDGGLGEQGKFVPNLGDKSGLDDATDVLAHLG
jgi:hypothetical protein